jgi:hypothetical protein
MMVSSAVTAAARAREAANATISLSMMRHWQELWAAGAGNKEEHVAASFLMAEFSKLNLTFLGIDPDGKDASIESPLNVDGSRLDNASHRCTQRIRKRASALTELFLTRDHIAKRWCTSPTRQGSFGRW